MKLSLILMFLVTVSNSHAEVLNGKIHSIIRGEKNEDDIVRLENGRVVFVDSKDASLLRGLQSKGNFEIVTNNSNTITAARSVNKGLLAFESEEEPLIQTFEASVLDNLNEVRSVYNRLNSNYQRESQCFNRAHVWANDEFKNHGIQSMKVFVFFTASYIRKARFNWWFHVAPLVKYKDDSGEVVSKVLDYRYADSPLSVKEWTDMFVYSNRSCLETTKFSEYDHNPQTEDCYLIYTSMYYWMPQDIAQRDTTNVEKENFSNGSVENAYWEAF